MQLKHNCYEAITYGNNIDCCDFDEGVIGRK